MYPRSYQLPDLREHTVSKGTSYHAETRQDLSPSSRARWWSWPPQKVAVSIRPIWNDYKKCQRSVISWTLKKTGGFKLYHPKTDKKKVNKKWFHHAIHHSKHTLEWCHCSFRHCLRVVCVSLKRIGFPGCIRQEYLEKMSFETTKHSTKNLWCFLCLWQSARFWDAYLFKMDVWLHPNL